jgi:hypothetical protein
VSNCLEKLEEWYGTQCDDEWEHSYGVKIETIDNPGWQIDIDLEGTSLSGKQFDEVKLERDYVDWVDCRVIDNCFEGRGGPKNLKEIILLFLSWAEEK